jgi:hypothetical protein
MLKNRFWMIFVTLLLNGCVTLAPEAASLKVTRDAADVKGCKILGSVEAHPPYVGQQDGMNQLRNKAAGLGGNVLFVTSYNVTATGMAYRCGP